MASKLLVMGYDVEMLHENLYLVTRLLSDPVND